MEPVTRISENLRPPPQPRAHAVTPVLAVERQAWFDLNGDGRISTKSTVVGGDAYLVGDGDGDGRVAHQLTYEPLDVRSRPVPLEPAPAQRPAPEAAPAPAPAQEARRGDAALMRRAEAAYREMSE